MTSKTPDAPKPATAPDSLTKSSEKAKVELDENDLDKATGGNVTLSDFSFTQTSNKSSPL